MLPLFTAPNLSTSTLTEGFPWDFSPDPAALENLRNLKKSERRIRILGRTTEWQVYSAIRGLVPTQIISDQNPAYAVRAFVADYDMIQSVEMVTGLVNQLPDPFIPQFLEITLGRKCRLVWVFEREVLTPDNAFAGRVLQAFAEAVNAETLLPGFDKAAYKPAERWTNGGEWYTLKTDPVPADICRGAAVKAGKSLNKDCKSEVSLEAIAAEVEKRFPGRWQGEFKVDATGVRFWDPNADAPAGCQVKPDGMLCFTGTVPFMRWSDIFGRAWVEEQSLLKLGEAASDIYFDGRNYWVPHQREWVSLARQDVMLALRARGLSDKTPKGATVSECERVLHHIQTSQRVHGAAPLVNYRPGLQQVANQTILNILDLQPVEPSDTPKTPEDFPFIHNFIWNHFRRLPGCEDPTPYFLAWLRRCYISLREYRPLTGQAIFDCGPKGNGKTLLVMRIVAPLLGYRTVNPYDYLAGRTTFNDELFSAYLWAINDEESPSSESARQKFLSSIKAAVVNPTHTYHPKFCSRLSLPWTGRLFITLNDDPQSVGMLPEHNSNTADKMMFFASVPYNDVWPENSILEATISRELPAFARWLLDWEPPAEVLSQTRTGVNSYYDPVILAVARQQVHAHDLKELLGLWVRQAVFWQDADRRVAELTPTDLLAHLTACDTLTVLTREWTVQQVAKSLTTLAKIPDSGIEHLGGTDRMFRITKSAFLT